MWFVEQKKFFYTKVQFINLKIADANPLFEVPAHREPIQDIATYCSDNDSNKSPERSTDVPERKLDEERDEENDNEKRDENAKGNNNEKRDENDNEKRQEKEKDNGKRDENENDNGKQDENKNLNQDDKENDKCDEDTNEDSSGTENGTGDGKKEEVKNYHNMEEFVIDTIRSHLGEHFEFDSMSEETEQELYDMFCDMNIIST